MYVSPTILARHSIAMPLVCPCAHARGLATTTLVFLVARGLGGAIDALVLADVAERFERADLLAHLRAAPRPRQACVAAQDTAIGIGVSARGVATDLLRSSMHASDLSGCTLRTRNRHHTRRRGLAAQR